MLKRFEDTSSVAHARGGDTPNKAWARALALTAPLAQNPTRTLPIRIDELAETFGDRAALIGEDETLSYRALAERANRYARWALDQGLSRGDVVCLVMHNCPDYLAAWLGITRIGAIAALINTHLVGESLAHAIRVASVDTLLGSGWADRGYGEYRCPAAASIARDTDRGRVSASINARPGALHLHLRNDRTTESSRRESSPPASVELLVRGPARYE